MTVFLFWSLFVSDVLHFFNKGDDTEKVGADYINLRKLKKRNFLFQKRCTMMVKVVDRQFAVIITT